MRLCLLLGALLATACAGSYRSGIGYGGEPGITPSAYEHYIRGRLAAEDGDHDTAIAEMRMAAASAPDQAEPRLAVGEELLAAGRLDAANHEAAYAVDTWPKDAASWRLLGRVRAAGTDVAGAVKALERAVVLDVDDEESWLMLAAAYHQTGDDRNAVEAYRRLVRALPHSAEGHFRLGRVVIGSDPSMAAKELRRAVELDPGHIDARISLADLYRQQGHADQAQEALREAFERSGDDAQVGERLYRVLLEGGDHAGAARLLRRLDGDWREAQVRLRLGGFLLQLHEGADALRVARSVLAKEEGFQPARLLEARALAQLGRHAEAVTACLSVPAGDDAYL
jgi:tetratricopeptide (TPR) repeat protein